MPQRARQVKAPLAQGYLVVDSKKCDGCCSCMLACSLVHEGKENFSLARIQVIMNPYGHYPNGIDVLQCRQCVYAVCLQVCPTGALHTDAENGNVRVIDEEKCLGLQCMKCIDTCPYLPSRIIWNHERNVAMKCDLCISTPYWNENGGLDGKQACIEVCPMEALRLVRKVPKQLDAVGYDVNLRGEGWPSDKT